MSESLPREAGGYMPQLDGLRAVAVGAVILQHTLPPKWVSAVEFGAAGVQLFFVLSGFLITGILLRARSDALERRQNRGHIIGAFYVRRFLRIFPLYYAVLGLAMLIGIPEATEPAAWHLGYATNIYCFVVKHSVGPLSHFWSLAVEEQFYLIWPTVVLFLPRRLLGPLFVVLIVGAPLFRAVMLIKTINPFVPQLMPSCLDSLGIGSLLALLWQTRDPAQVRSICRWCLASGLLLLLLGVKSLWAFVPFYRFSQLALLNTTLALIFVWIVNGAAHGFRGPLGALLASRPMVYLGTISYGMYVWQMFAAYPSPTYMNGLADYYPEENTAARLVVVAAFSLLAATLSWFFLERPINSLKRYFPYVRKRCETEESCPRPL